MFTIIGSVIGVILGLITVITNTFVLSTLPQLNLFLIYTTIMFSFMSFGAFAGAIIDLVIEKIK